MKSCSRFKRIIKEIGKLMLPRIHINLADRFKKCNYYNGKVKVRKIISIFGISSGISKELSEILNSKWKSAWLVIFPDGGHIPNWYIIDRIFWKTKSFIVPKLNAQVISVTGEEEELNSNYYWLKNDLYRLNRECNDILLSEASWLNDSIMDAAQILLCKALGTEKTYQSVLNWQKKCGVPFTAVNDGHIQLMHDGNNHWLLSFCTSGGVNVCDSLRRSINGVTKKCLKCLYRLFEDKTGKLTVSILPVQIQNDGYNCGLFAIAFAAEVLDGQSPEDAYFDVNMMRHHLINCLETESLIPFPKVNKRARVESRQVIKLCI